MPQISDSGKSKRKIARANEKYKNQIRELKRSYPWDEYRRAAFNPERFGIRVRTLRKEAGKSQQECVDSEVMTVSNLSKVSAQ